MVLIVLMSAGALTALWLQQLALRESNARGDDWRAESESLQARIGELDSRLERTEQALRQQERRISDASSTQRVVRDEMLAVGMRATAIEEAVARLAEGRTRADTAMRLNEVEFLLLQAAQLLQLGNDIDAARSALGLASTALQGVDDPLYRLLEESLAQELAMLESLPPDPRPQLRARVQGLIERTAELPAPPVSAPLDPDADAPRWQQLLDRLVTVRRVDAASQLRDPEQRQTGLLLLRLQLERALSALQWRDATGFHAALSDARALLAELTDGGDAAVQAADAEIAAMLEVEALSRPRVQLGRTLRELHAMRSTREQSAQADGYRAPAAAEADSARESAATNAFAPAAAAEPAIAPDPAQ
jgi:uroporphyrin-3 C-methyltransferase